MSQKMGAKIFFGPNPEDWGVYLGKYVEKYRGKIKNENRHETGLRSPEIGKRPPQALGGGGSGFFGLGGPNHNAPTQFPEKKILPAWQSVWFLASHTLKVLLNAEDLDPIWIYFRPKNFGTSVKSIYMLLQYPWNPKSENDTNDL